MLNITKAFIANFDGTEGTAVDYQNREIEFHVSQVPPSVVPYLEPNIEVSIEEDNDNDTLFVTIPDKAFASWLEREEELLLDEEDADALFTGTK
jgi:hypothetical protein